jgi:signal transduction histidine kinase
MQIRRLLFISFFVLLSLVALPLTTLSFFSTQSALQEEIGRNLTSDAAMLMEKLDMLLYERFQNVHSWSQLNIIQEGRIGDVDKVLSRFLSDLEIGYKGMYRRLLYVDTRQQIVAASTAELIGHTYQPSNDWLNTKIGNSEVTIENLQLTPPYDLANLAIRAPVYDGYTQEVTGQLYGFLDMQQIFSLLDKAVKSRSGDRYVILLDEQGRTIAASLNLRSPQILLKKTFANWKPDQGKALFVHHGDPITDSKVLVGYTNSTGYLGLKPMGWSILIFQSTDKAFLPIKVLWILFTVVIILTMLLAVWASHWISGRIAEPLMGLTQWVREVRQYDTQPPPKLDGTIEIRELETAFSDMLQELEHSRELIIQTAKLAVVGEMAAIMAHEVRTPLGILTTSAQWLQQEESLLSSEGKEMTQFILDESIRLNKLVTTLLECARPREPEMNEYNIHELLLGTVELLRSQADKKQIQIKIQLHTQNLIIDCDFELITQMLLNLLLNPIQILPVNGLIRITLANITQYLEIDIEDNGPGIAEEDYQRLYDPFFTKRDGGIGLGLTVTRQIVLAHHGKLFASRSQLGGACFTVLLPVKQV